MNKPPIHPENYISGVKVVDIGDLRVARGKTRRPKSKCVHKHLVYDPIERRVWCEDCEEEIDPFDAFEGIVKSYDRALKILSQREAAVKEAEQFNIRRRATKALDQVWRGKMLPCCVNCGTGMLPEDYVNIEGTVGREFTLKQRNKVGR